MTADSGTYDDATLQRRAALAQAMLGPRKEPIRHWAEGLSEMANGFLGNYQLAQIGKEQKAEKEKENAALYTAAGLTPPAAAAAQPSGFAKIAALLSGGGQSEPASPAAAPTASPAPPAPAPVPPAAAAPPVAPAAPAASPSIKPVVAAMTPGAVTPPVITPRAEVMPSATVWGDKEAEAAGLYGGPEPRKIAAAVPVPPAQPQAPVAQAMTPPQMPAPSANNGLFANVPQEKRAALVAGLTSKNPTMKAIAVQELGNYTKAEAPTDEMREYKLDSDQRKARGEAPLSFFDFKSGIKKAGATSVTTNVDKGEDSFAKEAGKAQAQRFDELAQGGQQAKQMVADIDTLTELGKTIGTGKAAEWKAKVGPYAEALGVKVDGLSDIQAYEAIVNRVAPSLRVKGSGAQSDLELKNFLKSLPSLGNTPDGNALAASTIKGLQENKIAAAEIGSKALTGEITRPEAEKQLRALPDPMTNFREFQKNSKAAPDPKAAPQVDPDALAEARRRRLIQ